MKPCPSLSGRSQKIDGDILTTSATPVESLTLLFQRLADGDAAAVDALLPQIYSELRELASSKLAWESAAQTLAPTALVHEAYLRLFGGTRPAFDNRRHFFAAASEAMRRVLVDHA